MTGGREVSLTPAENDPAALLTYVALALDRTENVDPSTVSALWVRSPTIGTAELQQFGAGLSSRRRAVVLVLDDVHELVSVDVRDALARSSPRCRPGRRSSSSGRAAIPLPLGVFGCGGVSSRSTPPTWLRSDWRRDPARPDGSSMSPPTMWSISSNGRRAGPSPSTWPRSPTVGGAPSATVSQDLDGRSPLPRGLPRRGADGSARPRRRRLPDGGVVPRAALRPAVR